MPKPHHSPPTVFIDGEAGTTGLEIAGRLARLGRYRLLSIAPERRKDVSARAALMRDAEVVILCLPDEAAIEAVALVESLGAHAPRIIDASSAHRVAPGWVYGFAEIAAGHAGLIKGARLVSNPGCYPTGAIALLRPLVAHGLVPADHPVSINAVSGYSGGGRTMIEAYERGAAPAFELYGLGLAHKHTPEIAVHAGLSRLPIFVPSVGNFRQGMIVSVPLHLDALPGRPGAGDVGEVLVRHYGEAGSVRVLQTGEQERLKGRLVADALAETDTLELSVWPSGDGRAVVLVARLDNLGKGAAGAAVQNLGLMTG